MTMPDFPEASRETLAARRRRVFDQLGDGVMVLPATPVQYSSRDNERPYASDRELFYLTGLTEPETVAVLVGGDEPRLVLFVRERDPDAELWAGPRLGPAGAEERVRPDACHPLPEMPDVLPGLLGGGDRLYYRFDRRDAVKDSVLQALATARSRGARRGTGPRGVIDPGEILDELRLRKDATELEAIRRACAITVGGHQAAAGAIRPGAGEWAVEAALEAAFRSAGATGPAFATIVGSGDNACVLHYVRNADTISDGDLVLVDAGAEAGCYCGDVTRTYPASGSFSPRQRRIYDLVDGARKAAIAATRPGATIRSVHDAAVRTMVEGLREMGVLSGNVDDLVEEGAHAAFFPHQTSHWLGLDVHDPGDYARAGEPRVLEPGMVFTVEPGLYFARDTENDVAREYAGIGVRIEDDVAVTADGCEVLTSSLPTSAADVEALVAGV